jgi:preprotein translocase subunit SecG
MELNGSATDGNRPRKATSKLTMWLATSFALLILYLTITTTLNVREITKLSDQLRALSVNVTALENDNHGHGESTNHLDK